MMILAEPRLFFSSSPFGDTSQMLASSARRSTATLFFTIFRSRRSSRREVGPLSTETVVSSPLCQIALHIKRIILAPLFLAVAALLSIKGIFNELVPMVVCAPAALTIF